MGGEGVEGGEGTPGADECPEGVVGGAAEMRVEGWSVGCGGGEEDDVAPGEGRVGGWCARGEVFEARAEGVVGGMVVCGGEGYAHFF